jgi:NAD(P)-dependent dehydrogenase (short-subunit alcohol dehydrogenase family)
MVDSGSGTILNLASIASKLALSERFAYSTSKGAVLAMTLSVAKDYVDKGIRCNCICPGGVHTPFVDGYLKEFYPDEDERAQVFQTLSEFQPIGRMGKPEEIAALAAFLCSDEASFITGSAYDVDGGTMTLR